MTEDSQYWAGTATGDAGPYSDDVFSDLWRELFLHDRTAMGVMSDFGNELAVTGVTSPVSVDTGRALVDGKRYSNDASLNVAIPTPSASNSRIDRIVLRKDWTAQTVRVTRVAGVEDPSPSAPSKTQSDGNTWDIDLATVLIDDGGTVTVTDLRTFIWSPLSMVHVLAKPAAKKQILQVDNTVPENVAFADRVRVNAQEPFQFFGDTPVEVEDGVAGYNIPADLDGYELVYVRVTVKTAPSGGPLEAEMSKNGATTQMLSTNLTIDDGETSSDTAATPAVIQTNGNEDVSDGDTVQLNILQANGAIGLRWEAGYRPKQ